MKIIYFTPKFSTKGFYDISMAISRIEPTTEDRHTVRIF